MARALFLALVTLTVLLPAVGTGGWLWLGDERGEPSGDAASTEDAVTVQAYLPPDNSVCQAAGRRPEAGSARHLPEVYTQRVEVDGIAIVAPQSVSADALEAARETVAVVFAENDLEETLAAVGAYVVVSAEGQQVLELPEFECLAGRPESRAFDHVCGLADQAAYPVAVVNELDLLGDPSGPCAGLNVLYHELGHLVQNFALGPADYYDLRLLYQDALNAGRYRRQYAGTNFHEYFAEGTQNYFHHGEPGGLRDRAWLAEYDPALFAVLELIYGGGE
ncbi:MAG: hypothetical protein M0R74_14500 [Dehalococcoidia bacterium]|nr:hypothetical protein [Dehalococcoidia bacterium]